ncbi:MAG: SpoIIE family protein phosphatase [Candidatus Aminicenantaceae bacterium]
MSKIYVYPKKGDDFHIKLGDSQVSLGRSADNDIPLPDPFCSSNHAIIVPKGERYFIQDNNSKNGVFLNGKKIEKDLELKKGDEILLGSTRIVYDLKIDTKVEVTDEPSSSANINTIMHLKDVLRKPDISTTIRADAKSLDIEAIKTEHKEASVIGEVTKALILHKPLDELVEHIMDLICERIPMDRGILMLRDDATAQLDPKVVRINNKQLMNQKIQVSQSIINTAVDRHSSILISDVQSDTRFKAQDSILKLNIQSAMCVPLWNNKDIIGIIYSDRISTPEQFSNNDLRLLTLLGNVAAVKIENAVLFQQALEQEKSKKELSLAEDIQKGLLPQKNPEVEGFEIVGINIPCLQIGGDYYDFLEIDEERMGIVIADVSGKGVGASLLMASLRAALQTEVHIGYNLDEMAGRLNNLVHRSTAPNLFISFFYCELNTKTGDLRYLNSGHNPPLILDKKKKITHLESCGLCLGMFPAQDYVSIVIKLNPGDTALLYTDGLTESRNKENQELTDEGLGKLLKKHQKLPAEKLMQTIFEELEVFTDGAEPMDDMTLVIIKRNG